MVSLLKQLTPDARASVKDRVNENERQTNAEIIPVVVASTKEYGFYQALVGFAFSLLAIGIGWYLFQDVTVTPEDWGSSVLLRFDLAKVILIAIAGFMIGVAFARWKPAVYRSLVPARTLDATARETAVVLFHRLKLTRTRAHTAVMICVCLFEKRVVVLGDSGINDRIEQQDWDSLRDTVLTKVRGNDLPGALIAGIEQAGQLLSKHFPAESDDIDEITNRLHIVTE